MFRSSLRGFFILGVFACAASGQSPTPYLPASEPDANKLMADRIRFVRDFYEIDNPTTDKLINELRGLVSFQEKYLTESSKSIYRIELAATLVMNDPNSPESERVAKQSRFKGQLEAIHARAPMSLSKIAAMADSMVGPQKADAAHAKMAAYFAGKLGGQPFSTPRLDGLVMPPLKQVKQNEVIATARPAPIPPQPATTLNPPNTAVTAPPATTPTLVPSATPQLAPSVPRDIKPAPPVSDWPTVVDDKIKKVAYSPEQKRVVEKIIAQCKARADALKTNPDADKPVESKHGKHKPLDLLYDELVQRVDALATAEQKAKLAPPAAPAPTAAPTGK